MRLRARAPDGAAPADDLSPPPLSTSQPTPVRPVATPPRRRGLLLTALLGLLAAGAAAAVVVQGMPGGLAAALTLGELPTPRVSVPAGRTAEELAASPQRARSREAAAEVSAQLDRTEQELGAGDARGALQAFTVAVDRLAVVLREDGRAALDARAELIRVRLVAAVGAAVPSGYSPSSRDASTNPRAYSQLT